MNHAHDIDPAASPLPVLAEASPMAGRLSTLLESVSIRDRSEIGRAARAMNSIAADCGLRPLMSSDIRSKKPMYDSEGATLLEGYFGWEVREDSWWNVPQLALISPFALACRFESEPFWCNSNGAYIDPHNRFLDNVPFASFFARADAPGSAIVVPVHLGLSQIGVALYLPADPSVTDLSVEFVRYASRLSLITRRFMKTYVLATRETYTVPVDSKLTKRQAQCLHWAAQGKTDAEIGIILSLTHASIRYHISAAVEALDCVNRCQAVVKATQLGYIGKS